MCTEMEDDTEEVHTNLLEVTILICYLSYQSRDVLDFIWFGWKRSKTDVMVMVMHRWIRWSSLFSLEERICLCIKQDGIWLIGAFRSESDRILVDRFRGHYHQYDHLSYQEMSWILSGLETSLMVISCQRKRMTGPTIWNWSWRKGCVRTGRICVHAFFTNITWRHQHFLLILIY